MSETGTPELKLSGLAPAAHDAVRAFATKLSADLDENLKSLSVVGSALTSDFQAGRSDINTVLTVARRSQDLLKRIASYGKAMGRKRLRAPLLMTEEYVRQSQDVFGVEFLDFQLNHLTVLGDDPFAALEINKSDLRAQCERELKVSLIGLRQGYIRAAGDRRLVVQLMVGCLSNVLPVARAMLWLHDVPRSPLIAETIAAASKQFEFSSADLEQVARLRHGAQKPSAERAETLFEGLYRAVDHLSREVDRLETKG